MAMVVVEKGKEAGEGAVAVAVAVEVVEVAGVAAAAVACLDLPHQLALPWCDGPWLALGTPVKALVR